MVSMSVVRTDSTSTSSQSKPKKSSVKEEEFAKVRRMTALLV